MREYVERNQKLMPGGIGTMIPKSAAAIRMGHLFNKIMLSKPLRPLAARAFASEDPFTPRDYATELASPTRCG
jgi:hypothetical protein